MLPRVSRSIARLGVASLLGGLAALDATVASAATGCDPTTLMCTRGSAALHGAITTRLPTEIDSGVMEKSGVSIRARFNVDPAVQGQPLLTVDMPTGAFVEASWTAAEKNTLSLKALTDAGQTGTVNVHYTLTPNLEATLFGVTINRSADDLLQQIPGSRFNYDASTSATLVPWGFVGAAAVAPAPVLDSSTLFSLPFTDLGIDTDTAEGELAIQAAASPTFTYTTKSVQFDSVALTSADGTAKVPVGDVDAIDINALVVGDVLLAGDLDIRPVIKADSIAGIPTFGLTKYSFSAVKKSFGGGAAVPVSFQNASIHIALPNVKVPTTPIGAGTVKAGDTTDKTVSITNSGELGAVLKITSSDPRFVVPSGTIQVPAKGTYDLKVTFQPDSDGPASADITVASNDPDSPEQVFKIGANGADIGDSSTSGKKKSSHTEVIEDAGNGCGCKTAGTSSSSSGALGFGLALGLSAVLAGRRRRA